MVESEEFSTPPHATIVRGAASCRQYLEVASGLILIATEDCDLCNTVWQLLKDPQYQKVRKAKLILDYRIPDDLRLLRGLSVRRIPLLCMVVSGIEAHRMEPPSSRVPVIQQYVTWLRSNAFPC